MSSELDSPFPASRYSRAAHTPTRSRMADGCRDLDRLLTGALRPVTFPALRVLLGLLFVWFGALKVFGRSPVGELVSGTLPWADPRRTVAALGAIEVVLGLGLVTTIAVRLILPVVAAHLAGTFLTFAMLPHLMFTGHNPLLLTESGEFVAKNVVLIASTLVLIAHTGVPPLGERDPARRLAPEVPTTRKPAGTHVVED